MLTFLRHSVLPFGARAPRSTLGPLVIAGMFRTANGVGQSARGMVEALRARGFSPIAVDLSDMFNQVDAEAPFALSEMPRGPAGTLILVANAPETRLALRKLKRWRWQRWRIIGYWAWELDTPPAPWFAIARHLSELWVPSDFIANGFRGQLARPVRTVPIPVAGPGDALAVRQEDGVLRVLVMGDGRSSFHRKNLVAAVRVFARAFAPGTPAALTVKIRNGAEFPAYLDELKAAIAGHPGITLIDASVSDTERWDLLNSHDILLSTHRAEGFGLPLAEAMMLGKTVVATGWSGNRQFMTPENSVLLPYTLEPVSDPTGVYADTPDAQWARIDEDAAVIALQALAADPARRRALGQQAARDVADSLNSDALVAALQATPP